MSGSVEPRILLGLPSFECPQQVLVTVELFDGHQVAEGLLGSFCQMGVESPENITKVVLLFVVHHFEHRCQLLSLQ